MVFGHRAIAQPRLTIYCSTANFGLCLRQIWFGEPKLPSGYVKIAIENGPFIVDFPIKHGDFPISYVIVYQRVP